MAAIKQTLGVYTEAIEEYKIILGKSPNYVPALKGRFDLFFQTASNICYKWVVNPPKYRYFSDFVIKNMFL